MIPRIKLIAIAALTAWSASAQSTPVASERSAREEAFIADVQKAQLSRQPQAVAGEWLEHHVDSVMKVSGSIYLRPQISDTGYYRQLPDSSIAVVWDADYPAESMANLMVVPDAIYGSVPLEVDVLLHDYGKTAPLRTTIDNFIAFCEADGCQPFWGVEKLNDDNTLEGALFLHNPDKGYDHVLKIECDPAQVIASRQALKGHVSLFIPINNVSNLFRPSLKEQQARREREKQQAEPVQQPQDPEIEIILRESREHFGDKEKDAIPAEETTVQQPEKQAEK